MKGDNEFTSSPSGAATGAVGGERGAVGGEKGAATGAGVGLAPLPSRLQRSHELAMRDISISTCLASVSPNAPPLQ